MASPNFDAIDVQVSRAIGDPVATATTDGKSWTAAQRNTVENIAIRRWLGMQLAKAVRTGNWYPLKDYISEDSQTTAASVKTLSSWTGGVVWIIGEIAYNTTDSAIVWKAPQEIEHIIANSINTYLTPSTSLQYYTVDGSQFRLLGGSAASSIKLRHVQQHTALSSNGPSDILIPSEFWDTIIEMATIVAYEDQPTKETNQVAMFKAAQIQPLMSF